MKSHSLAVCLDDLRLETKEALDRARSLGFHAIDVGATQGAISPQELSRTGQRHLAKHLSDLGLRLGSLRGPVRGPGYTDGAHGERRLDTMRQVVGLASALHVPVVSTALGVPGGTPDERQQDRLREVLRTLADDADRARVIVTLETAGLPAATLNRLLQEINCPYLAACCDTGAMLMQGEDPHAIGLTLPGRVQLARVRDAVAGSISTPGYEVSLGEGQLEPARLLAGLAEAGFGGDLVLSRSGAANPAAELRRMREAFARQMRG